MPEQAEVARVNRLEAKNCYVGQRVYWVMWRDPKESEPVSTTVGWYRFAIGREAEIWSATVEKLTARTITLTDHGKIKKSIYASAPAAITAEYHDFCRYQLFTFSVHGALYGVPPQMPLGVASLALRELAKLEFNLHMQETKKEE